MNKGQVETPPPIQNLKQRQIMLSFAYLAYCGELITKPAPEKTILSYINAAMLKITPLLAPNDTWKVVWGPAVYTTPGALLQDNLMFVAQNESDATQFVVAIRGTNGTADLDWLMEDFDVLDMMNWPPGTPNPRAEKISESTSVALQILLAMQGESTGGTDSLLTFLKEQTSQPINICVTGHSLGGCLAPTLALYMKEQRSTWDGSGASNVSTISFAGPTAGNAAFAKYSDSQFQGGPYPPHWDASLGTNCDAVRCNLDVAPLAWIGSNIVATKAQPYSPLCGTYAPPNVPKAPNLNFSGLGWGSGLAWSYVVKNFFPTLAAVFTERGYTQVVADAATIPGTFHTPIKSGGETLVPPPTDGLTDYLKAFVAEATYQHSGSYPNVLGVPELMFPNVINKGQSGP